MIKERINQGTEGRIIVSVGGQEQDISNDIVVWDSFLPDSSWIKKNATLRHINSMFPVILGKGCFTVLPSDISEESTFTAIFGGTQLTNNSEFLYQAVKRLYGFELQPYGIVSFVKPNIIDSIEEIASEDGVDYPYWNFIHWNIINAFSTTTLPDRVLSMTLISIFVIGAILPVEEKIRTRIIQNAIRNFFMSHVGEPLLFKDAHPHAIEKLTTKEENVSLVIEAIKRGKLKSYELPITHRSIDKLASEVHNMYNDIQR